MDPKTFSLDELCSLCALPRRTVRYYIQIGLLARPVGETRAAYYTSAHLDRLLEIRRLTEAGISLERIRTVLAGEPPAVPPRPRQPGALEVRTHLLLAPGLELQIRPEEAGLSPEQVRALAEALMKAVRQVLHGSTHDTGESA